MTRLVASPRRDLNESTYLAIGLNSMLQTVQLPAGVTNLNTSLTNMDWDTFTLKRESSSYFFFFNIAELAHTIWLSMNHSIFRFQFKLAFNHKNASSNKKEEAKTLFTYSIKINNSNSDMLNRKIAFKKKRKKKWTKGRKTLNINMDTVSICIWRHCVLRTECMSHQALWQNNSFPEARLLIFLGHILIKLAVGADKCSFTSDMDTPIFLSFFFKITCSLFAHSNSLECHQNHNAN